eukprot:CAMPEP_0184507152 /NCGR_PEP_ID=MMETSP0198_2-20121128/93_1 /TAXON_ID=1112570 /ORGANISM="Thraustochytrium sp., Strain LLF1b" /LENGTH=685 /DNA_ID=CAMNT_0026896887 /DNA_START=781 /DNA_END=2838 /DNA_ORIENTATION=-
MEDGVRFGGGGGHDNHPFELGPGEWISEIRGRRGMYLDQIQFFTNLGRESERYGSEGGEPFSLHLPGYAPIGGLDVVMSINGWLRYVRNLTPLSETFVRHPEPPKHVKERGIVRAHQVRVRRRFRLLHCGVVLYVTFLIAVAGGFLLDMLHGPQTLTRDVAVLPFNEWNSSLLRVDTSNVLLSSAVFQDGNNLAKWVIHELDMRSSGNEHDSFTVLSKVVVENRVEGKPRLSQPLHEDGIQGVVRRIEPEMMDSTFHAATSKFSRAKWLGSPNGDGPMVYIDESFSPVLLYLGFGGAVCLLGLACRNEWRQSNDMDDPVLRHIVRRVTDEDTMSDNELARLVDEEVLEDTAFVVPWSSHTIAVTRNWLLRTNYFGMDAIAINDARLSDVRISGRWIMGEPIETVTLRIESRQSVVRTLRDDGGRASYYFDVTLPRRHFEVLQASFIDRVNKRQEEQAKRCEQAFVEEYCDVLIGLARDGINFDLPFDEEKQECLGVCGNTVDIKIDKQCGTCEERAQCLCPPAWCHRCILKWWCSQNRTRIELLQHGGSIQPTWQGRCPTCRIWFCLNDLVPTADIAQRIKSCNAVEREEAELDRTHDHPGVESSALGSSESEGSALGRALLTPESIVSNVNQEEHQHPNPVGTGETPVAPEVTLASAELYPDNQARRRALTARAAEQRTRPFQD